MSDKILEAMEGALAALVSGVIRLNELNDALSCGPLNSSIGYLRTAIEARKAEQTQALLKGWADGIAKLAQPDAPVAMESSDLVEQLKTRALPENWHIASYALCIAAADEIERLQSVCQNAAAQLAAVVAERDFWKAAHKVDIRRLEAERDALKKDACERLT